MRPFLAISLVVMTGCGDNLGGDGGNTDVTSGDNFPVEDTGVVSKLVPEVCGVRSWDTVIPTAKDIDLAVVQMPQGAGILSVPKQGGYLTGFLVDARGLIMSEIQGTKVRTDGTWTGVSAANIDDRLVVGLTDGVKTSVSVVRDDLGDFRELAVVDGGVLGDAPLVHSRGARVAAVGDVSGIVTSVFDQAWTQVGSEVLNVSAPISLTTATYGSDAIIAWSTENDCNLSRLAAGTHSVQPFACRNAKLAMNFNDRSGELVFERGNGITLSDIRINSHGEIANEIPIVSEGRSPRIAFDGERYWISYLNTHGDIVVGYLDEDYSIVSTAIEFTRPAHDAYELAMIDGEMWLYSLDGDAGFGAHKLCLTR
jgi:hypothetical protein